LALPDPNAWTVKNDRIIFIPETHHKLVPPLRETVTGALSFQ
jgi:hypothetical protein